MFRCLKDIFLVAPMLIYEPWQIKLQYIACPLVFNSIILVRTSTSLLDLHLANNTVFSDPVNVQGI